LKRDYENRQRSHKQNLCQPAPGGQASPGDGQIQLPLDREELLELMQDSLESLALELGLLVASSLLEDEVTRLCGPRYQRQPDRTHTRYGHQRGVATLAGQKVAIERPRVRHTGGRGERPLELYARLQSPDAMPRAVLRRMVRGSARGTTPGSSSWPATASAWPNRASAATSSGPPPPMSRR
jgi:hypothetical protein